MDDQHDGGGSSSGGAGYDVAWPDFRWWFQSKWCDEFCGYLTVWI